MSAWARARADSGTTLGDGAPASFPGTRQDEGGQRFWPWCQSPMPPVSRKSSPVQRCRKRKPDSSTWAALPCPARRTLTGVPVAATPKAPESGQRADRAQPAGARGPGGACEPLRPARRPRARATVPSGPERQRAAPGGARRAAPGGGGGGGSGGRGAQVAGVTLQDGQDSTGAEPEPARVACAARTAVPRKEPAAKKPPRVRRRAADLTRGAAQTAAAEAGAGAGAGEGAGEGAGAGAATVGPGEQVARPKRPPRARKSRAVARAAQGATAQEPQAGSATARTEAGVGTGPTGGAAKGGGAGPKGAGARAAGRTAPTAAVAPARTSSQRKQRPKRVRKAMAASPCESPAPATSAARAKGMRGECTPEQLSEFVQARYAELQREQQNAGVLYDRIREIELQAASMRARHQIARRRALEQTAQHLRERAQVVECGQVVHDFCLDVAALYRTLDALGHGAEDVARAPPQVGEPTEPEPLAFARNVFALGVQEDDDDVLAASLSTRTTFCAELAAQLVAGSADGAGGEDCSTSTGSASASAHTADANPAAAAADGIPAPAAPDACAAPAGPSRNNCLAGEARALPRGEDTASRPAVAGRSAGRFPASVGGAPPSATQGACEGAGPGNAAADPAGAFARRAAPAPAAVARSREECVTRDQVPVLVMPDCIQDMAQQRQRQVTKPVVRVLAHGKTSPSSVTDTFLEKHGTVPKPLCTISDEVCSACSTGHLVLDVVTDMLVCEHCRNEQECTQASDRGAGYGGAQAPHYSACRYNRISHYSTHLDRACGCVGSDKITPQLLTRVMQCLKDSGVQHVNVGHVERALKDLDLSKLCSHKVVITARITGIPPPAFSPPERCMLLEMFIHINAAFIKLRRANQLEGRLNYLSYPYTIYKCVEMLTWGQKYLLYFNLLRCDDNLAKQDRCWEKICAEVNLPFIRSTYLKAK